MSKTPPLQEETPKSFRVIVAPASVKNNLSFLVVSRYAVGRPHYFSLEADRDSRLDGVLDML